ISNMLTCALPPKTAFSVSLAWIIRLFFLSCSPLRLMYAHNFLVTSVRGIGFEPTTSESAASGATGFMNAAFGFLLLFAFLAISSPCDVVAERPMGRPLWLHYYARFRPSVLALFFEMRRVIRDAPGGSRLERGAQRGWNRQLRQRARVDQHIDRFNGDDHAVVAGNSELGADRKGSGAQPGRRNRQLQDLVVAGGRVPLDGLLHQLEVEWALDELRQHAGGTQELGDRDVDVLGVARVENDLLRVALDVANA